MQLIYEGTDIYNDISVSQCIYDSYGEQRSDTLKVIFNDTRDLWDGWNPQKGDSIRAILGACDTGEMHVVSVKPENGLMCLRANSIPEDYNDRKNKSWEVVTFKQICAEVADRHGLSCEFYGVDDYTYEYVNQQNHEDFVFLEARCVLEGCAFLVYDNRLVVYSEAFMESGTPKDELIISNDVKFDYTDDSKEAYETCIVKNGAVTGMHSVEGTTNKVLERILSVKISSQAEADRFAKNLLRFENKKMTGGVCYSDKYLPGYAAGTLINLTTAGAASWNGPVIMTHVRHDMLKATTKLFFRKPLEGY